MAATLRLVTLLAVVLAALFTRPQSAQAQAALEPQQLAPPAQTPPQALPAPRPPLTPAPTSTPQPGGPILPEERPIAALTADITPKTRELPPDTASAHFAQAMPAADIRPWRDNVYFWEAPAFCHRPLYFQETNLERYGYSPCYAAQPAISAAHFFASTVTLPYAMAVHPTRECVYPLGYYRPGSPAPRQIQWPELQARGLTAEAALAAGIVLIIP